MSYDPETHNPMAESKKDHLKPTKRFDPYKSRIKPCNAVPTNGKAPDGCVRMSNGTIRRHAQR